MAEPIPLHLPPRDPREPLYDRLQNVPREHVEALLDVCDILQLLRDKGLLEIAKGLLGSGEEVLQILVKTADSPEVIRGIRNFMILTKLFGTLEPKLLEHLADAVPRALVEAKTEKPLGTFGLASTLMNQDTRRVLTIMTRVAESLGKGLGQDDQGHAKS
jgi:uncharacterized protein YjgD (DUF1641 family)